MFKKILVLLLAVMLIGCGKKGSNDSAVKTSKFEGMTNGIKNTVVLTYDEKNDKLLSQKINTEVSIKGIPNKENILKEVENFSKEINKNEGVKDKIEIKDDKIIEELTLDYTAVKDWEKVSNMMVGLTKEEKERLIKVKSISYKLTVEKFKQLGYKEVK